MRYLLSQVLYFSVDISKNATAFPSKLLMYIVSLLCFQCVRFAALGHSLLPPYFCISEHVMALSYVDAVSPGTATCLVAYISES